MIICHCNTLSDRHVRDAVDCGACSVDDVGAHCGAGTRCGSCRPTIDVLLARFLVPEQAEPAA